MNFQVKTIGVTFDPIADKFKLYFRHNHELLPDEFDTHEEAIEAREDYLKRLELPEVVGEND